MAVPNLINITLKELSQGLDSKTFTSVDLVRAYLARIQEVQSEYNAIIENNPDALDIARDLDAERETKGRRGPLHGVPIVIKDNMVTHDKMSGSSGSWALFGAKPPREATVVRKLREAGAVVLASANLSEWACFRSTHFHNGWSPRAGRCKGLFAKDHTPSGSSSGSAIAAALGLGFAALGTETAGSLINPGRHNNLVTIKPTPGMTSRDGVIPVTLERDTVGPLARTVTDAAHILDAIAGQDENDPHSLRVPTEKRQQDYAPLCESTSLTGLRVGVPRNQIAASIHSDYLRDFNDALEVLKKQGAVVVDTDYPAGQAYAELDDDVKAFCPRTEFKRDIEAYLKAQIKNPNNIKTLDDLIAYTKSESRERANIYDIDQWEAAAKTNGVDDPAYVDIAAKEAYYGGPGGIDGALDAHGLDVLVMPGAPLHEQIVSIARCPIVSVPLGCFPPGTEPKYLGDDNGMFIGPGVPYSMYVFGKAYSEANLIRVAFVVEQCFEKKSHPKPLAPPQVDLCDFVGR